MLNELMMVIRYLEDAHVINKSGVEQTPYVSERHKLPTIIALFFENCESVNLLC